MKHRRPDLMLKYYLILKVLLKLENFDAIGAIEKTINNKITNKVYKEQSARMIKLTIFL